MSEPDALRIPDPITVEGKVVVITGGRGRLGGQFANALVKRGARVASVDLLPSHRGAATFGAEEVSRHLDVIADVTNRGSLLTAREAVISTFGVPDGLITCAAIDSPPDVGGQDNARFEDYPEDAWRRVLEVNLTGVFLSCQVFGSAMVAQGRGSIANVSSIYGVVGPDQRIYQYRRDRGDDFYKPPSYSASKGGVQSLTRYLAAYWGSKGVRVNNLVFGGVAAGQDDAFVRGYTSRTPLGRMANEDEYNGAILFLMSDASSYMTGADVVIDGGWTSW